MSSDISALTEDAGQWEIAYTFEMDGETHTGSSSLPSYHRNRFEGSFEEWVDKHTPGQPLTVHYMPDGRSSLTPWLDFNEKENLLRNGKVFMIYFIPFLILVRPKQGYIHFLLTRVGITTASQVPG